MRSKLNLGRKLRLSFEAIASRWLNNAFVSFYYEKGCKRYCRMPFIETLTQNIQKIQKLAKNHRRRSFESKKDTFL